MEVNLIGRLPVEGLVRARGIVEAEVPVQADLGIGDAVVRSQVDLLVLDRAPEPFMTLSPSQPPSEPTPHDVTLGEVREADAAGRQEAAVNALALAARNGNIVAMTELALRLVIGDRAPCMPLQAAGLLKDAAGMGGAEAAGRLAVLTATGVYVRQSWPQALELLAISAERGWEPARGQLRALVGRADPDTGILAPPAHWRQLAASVDIAAWGRPAQAYELNTSPQVCHVPDFVSPSICEWLIARARYKLARARVYDAQDGVEITHETRTNKAATFNLMETDLVQLLMQTRMAATCGLPFANMEAPAVLHYSIGEQISEHYDFVDPAIPNYAAEIERSGQRMITFLAYLNEDYGGGETAFPKLNIIHRGRRGDGLYFVNAYDGGKPDLRSVHAGRPPVSGEKWIVSQFVRDRVMLPTLVGP